MPSQPPRRRLRAATASAAVTIALALVLGACSGAASPSPSPSPSPTPTAIVSPGAAELRIPLPSGWHEIELTEVGLQAEIDALVATNPEAAETIRQLLASGAFEGFLFYGIGYEGTEPIGNVTAVTFPMPGLGLDTLTPLITGQLEQIGATDVRTSERTVLGTPGLVIDYHAQDGEGASGTITGRAYVAIVEGAVYDITVTCAAADPAPCLADADAMVDGATLVAR
ncbi:MAG: hypothetical protein EPO36_09405 [Chloroflexota bacterium]|nr:MAG: hypothetical protein EPO36_09405 [Chloroflexota bacterium]